MVATRDAKAQGASTFHRHEFALDGIGPSCLEPRPPIRGMEAWRCNVTSTVIVSVPGQSRAWAVKPKYPQVPR